MTKYSNESVEKNPSSSGLSNVFAVVTVIICLLIGFAIWKFVLGNPSNFVNGDPNGDPLEGNLVGMMYKGGYVIGVLIGLLTMTIVFGIERMIVISKASGKGNVKEFVAKVQTLVNTNKVYADIEECDNQQGSVANVVKAALLKFKEAKAEGLSTDEATEVIQKEIEEATVLEMPMLEKNMIILATLVSIGTLVGLLG